MEKEKEIKIEKPEWKWYYSIPLIGGKGKRDYYNDRKIFEDQFKSESEKVRDKQTFMIDSISLLLISVIIMLWSILPQTIDLPHSLNFIKLGMQDVSWQENWAGAVALTFVPSLCGFVVQKAPRIFPNKKVRFCTNILIKIIPVIILVICYYLIYTEKEYWKYKKLEKLAKLAKTSL